MRDQTKRGDAGRDKILQNIYTPYSLRHFYASMLIAENKDLKTIQGRGHVDAAMTLNVYGHLIKDGCAGLLPATASS
jgi:site-specific recombinase XerD